MQIGLKNWTRSLVCVGGYVLKSRIGLLALALVVSVSAPAAMTFNLSYLAGTTAQQQTAFQQAAARWSNIFNDNITINLTVGTANLGSGILGSTSSPSIGVSYASFRSALIADATSSDDTIATSNLQAGPSLSVRTNRWSNNPNGSNSLTAYTASLTNISITRANAKAVGLLAGTNTSSDGSITFTTNTATLPSGGYSYTPGTVASNQIDFVGIATHEIGHALGFVSGVDIVDGGGNGTDTASAWFRPMDLYRFSSASGTIPDVTAGTATKYFSLDKGVTGQSVTFSTGVTDGDGRQASHWKDGLGLGIMDPTASNGETLAISANDIKMFDVIGYNLAPVPEPATMVALGLGAMALVRRRKNRS